MAMPLTRALFVLSQFVFVSLALAQKPADVPAEVKPLLGHWEVPTDNDKYTMLEIWHIRYEKGKLAVSGTWKDTVSVYEWNAKDVKFAKSQLSVVKVWVKPPYDWPVTQAITGKLEGDELKNSWVNSKNMPGSRVLSRVVKPVGVWEGKSKLPDLKEVWTIKTENGIWSARCVYFKGDAEAGSLEGKTCKYYDGRLLVQPEFDKKATGYWPTSTYFSCVFRDDKMYSNHVNSSPGFITCTRVKP